MLVILTPKRPQIAIAGAVVVVKSVGSHKTFDDEA